MTTPATAITFTVPAVPVAQPRQRHRVVTSGGRTFAQNYTPAKSPVSEYKATLRLAASQAYQGPPLEGPLSVSLLFLFNAKSKRARKPKATRPDCDNLAKSTLDALNGLLFIDDGQVVKLAIEKWHADGTEQPHVLVSITSLEG